MNADCMEMSRRIESSIGNALEPSERDEIERHCAACESCRAYREQLLGDHSRLAEFAAPRVESIGKLQARAIERVRTMEAAPRGRAGRVVARIPRIAAIAAAAAVVVIAFLVIDLIRGGHNGPVPAFAAVVEKIQNCDNVIYRDRRWSLGEWTTSVRGRTSSGVRREEQGDSITISDDYLQIISDQDFEFGEKILKLYPGEKLALISGTSNICSRFENAESTLAHPRGKNVLDGFAGLYKSKMYSYVRSEGCEGTSTAVYQRNSGKPGKPSTFTIWVDLKTQLPVRMEVFKSRGADDPLYCYGVSLSDFVPEGSEASGWIDLKPDEPYEIYDDFRWNAAVDTFYFSFVPPPGYSVETRRNIVDYRGPEGDMRSKSIARWLSAWLAISGNRFPDDLHDLADSTKVKPLLLAKFRRGEDPVKEFRDAYREAREFRMRAGVLTLLLDVAHSPLVYSGKGAIFGDSNKVVCRLQFEDEPCYTIYGDLHIVASPAPPKLVGE